MSRKKTKINPQRAENIKEICKREGINQKELAEKTFQTQQNVSRIIQKKSPLTEENAEQIIKAYPKYRIEWLLGYDDYPTYGEYIRSIQDEAHLLDIGLSSFIRLSGFEIDTAQIEGKQDIENVLQDLEEYCTISRNGKALSFSLEEFNAFENEICDYIEFRLLHMMNQLNSKNK